MRSLPTGVWRPLAVALVAGLSCAVPSFADSLTISPTRLMVPAPRTETTLTVKADGRQAVQLQFRVMKWRLGTDPSRLHPTRDVVASPPFARLKPRQELTLRLVRIAKRPLRGRECYRVLVDRLPEPDRTGRAVRLLIRQSVPLCFGS